MDEIGVKELKDHLSEYLRRAEAGEGFGITVSGRRVATLLPPSGKQMFIRSEDFNEMIRGRRADHALLKELKDLLPDTTDDLSY
jgi:prevent-host-death family protein